MTERRNWGEAREWGSDAYSRAITDAQQIEGLMRHILKLFADGCLVYRDRTSCASPVSTKSDRLKRLRRELTTVGADANQAAVA